MTEDAAFTLIGRLRDQGFLPGIDCSAFPIKGRPSGRKRWCVAVTPMERTDELESVLGAPLDGHRLRRGTYYILDWSARAPKLVSSA